MAAKINITLDQPEIENIIRLYTQAKYGDPNEIQLQVDYSDFTEKIICNISLKGFPNNDTCCHTNTSTSTIPS